MYNIFNSLTSQNIKAFNVLYDTLFLNFKAIDTVSSESFDYVLIQKMNFDYDTNSISSSNDVLINFGDTGSTLPFTSNGTMFVDFVLLEKPKTTFVCGTSSLSSSYLPVIYNYNINNGSLKKLYPTNDADVNSWNSINLGTLSATEQPFVSYNSETKTLNYVFKTKKNSSYQLNDVEFYYNENKLVLSNVNCLTASLSSVLQYSIVKFSNYNDNEKILLFKNGESIIPLSLNYQ